MADARVSSLVGTIDVTSQSGRDSALGSIDSALASIGDSRSELGAAQNQLMSNIRNISVGQISAAASESQMRDVDFAAESANFSQQNIMSQIGSFAQAQANASASSVTRLFQ
jgi:flagellin